MQDQRNASLLTAERQCVDKLVYVKANATSGIAETVVLWSDDDKIKLETKWIYTILRRHLREQRETLSDRRRIRS